MGVGYPAHARFFIDLIPPKWLLSYMWIIGDIHGCREELELLLEALPPEEKLLFLGDYIDRGPDSKGTIERVLKEKRRSIFLMGNHEDMLMNYYHKPESPMGQAWLFGGNGGQSTLVSYAVGPKEPFDKLPSTHQEFYAKLRLYHEAEDFIAVHAGLRVQAPFRIDAQERRDLLWIRHEWLENTRAVAGKENLLWT